MYQHTLIFLMKLRGVNQSGIARFAGLSRQAVSLWFTSSRQFQNIQVLHLVRLARRLRVSLNVLVTPIPIISSRRRRRALQAEFCWDSLYPDIESFFIELSRFQVLAVARLVSCRGLYEAAKVLGPRVWGDYKLYRHLLPPVIQKERDCIWQLRSNPTIK